MAKRYMVTRDRHHFQAISIFADSKEEAIEQSRSKKNKEWSTLDENRKTGYAAKRVKLSGSRRNDGTENPTVNGDDLETRF
jgi:hypothetical protein